MAYGLHGLCTVIPVMLRYNNCAWIIVCVALVDLQSQCKMPITLRLYLECTVKMQSTGKILGVIQE